MTSVRRWMAARPLRTRLVATLLAVVAIALFIAGFAARSALGNYLLNQVDARLLDATTAIAAPRDPLAGGNPPPRGGSPLTPANSYTVIRDDQGDLVRVLPTSAQNAANPPDLPEATIAQIEPGVPFEVPSLDGSGTWRVMAQPLASGDGYVMVAADVTGIYDTLAQLVIWQLAVGVLVLLGLGMLGYLIVRRALAPLEQVEHAAALVAGGDLGARVPDLDPNTEVGRLAGSFNTMVGNVEAAFGAQAQSEAAARASAQQAQASEARMRRFVADASHELRTPLTSIRGYSELYRIGAIGSGEKLRDAMGRIEDEAARMGLLVDDLLLLARLDQQRPLELAQVDLLELAAAAAGAARAAAPGRLIEVEVGAGPDAAGGGAGDSAGAGGSRTLVVRGDSARLRQVLDNLLGNALRYTPAGTPIVIRLGAAGPSEPGWASVEVVDRGPGLSADAAGRVFERFYREDKARSRAAGGSGLGLAIVAAIVTAHGGRVELDTAPGAGATFRVLLPA